MHQERAVLEPQVACPTSGRRLCQRGESNQPPRATIRLRARRLATAAPATGPAAAKPMGRAPRALGRREYVVDHPNRKVWEPSNPLSIGLSSATTTVGAGISTRAPTIYRLHVQSCQILPPRFDRLGEAGRNSASLEPNTTPALGPILQGSQNPLHTAFLWAPRNDRLSDGLRILIRAYPACKIGRAAGRQTARSPLPFRDHRALSSKPTVPWNVSNCLRGVAASKSTRPWRVASQWFGGASFLCRLSVGV